MGELNTAPMKINKVEGTTRYIKMSGGPGVTETWERPGSLAATCIVVANNAKAETKVWATNLQAAGYPVWVCDHVDDQVEIQAALDAASAAGGGTVSLSEGSFKLTSPIIAKSLVNLIGKNQRYTVLKAEAAIPCIISFPTGVQNSQIRMADFNLNGGDIPGQVVWAIDAYNLAYSTLENIFIQYVITGGGIYLRAPEGGKVAWQVAVKSCNMGMNAAADYGLRVESSDNHFDTFEISWGKGILNNGGANRYSGVHVDWSSVSGFRQSEKYAVQIIGCIFENNTGRGIWISKGSPADNFWATIQDCLMFSNGQEDIRLEYVNACTMMGNCLWSTINANSIVSLNSDFNIAIGNLTEGNINLAGVNNEVAHNIQR